MANKKFKKVPGPFGGYDEQATQDAFVEFVGGTHRAEQLSRMWQNSHPTGTEYDKMMGNGQFYSREDNFRRKAEREGFSKEEIAAFLSM